MKKKKKAHSIKFLFLVTLILVISVGYAALSAIFNINGNIAFYKNFDVYLDNVVVKDGSASASVPAIITDKTSLDFKVDFYSVSDYYEFTFDIVNNSDVKAMIGNIDKPVFTAEQENCLDFSLKYHTGAEVKVNDAIMPHNSVTVTALLKYNDTFTVDDFQNTTLKGLGFSTSFGFVPADENANTLEPFVPPRMMNIGASTSTTSQFSELKSYYSKLATVTLNDSVNVPEGVPNWDISEAGNGSVMAYVVPNSTDNAKYDLHIEGEGGISAPEDSSYLFSLCKIIKHTNYSESLPATYSEIIGLNLLNTKKVKDMVGMFSDCQSLTSLDLSNFNTSNVTNMIGMFRNCSGLTSLDLSKFSTRKVTGMGGMFEKCSGLTSLNLANFKTGRVTSMISMFSDCSGIKSLDLSNFDTSNVTRMEFMFNGCSNLTNINLSSFDTSKVTLINSMFYNCSSLSSLDLSSFDTTSAVDISAMFYNCKSLNSLDLSNFDTSKVYGMSQMFYGCAALRNLDFRNATFDKVNDYSDMFTSASWGMTIKVKDSAAKSWILTKNSNANVEIVGS